MENTIYAHKGAEQFEQTFVLGNGSIGAAVYGRAAEEKISLNEDTLWSGFPREKNRAGAHKYLDKVRTLIEQKKLKDATRLIHEEFLCDFNESYQPAGTLLLSFEQEGMEKSLRRVLSLDTAVARTEVVWEGHTVTREHFCSHVHNGFITKITSDREISFTVRLTSPHPYSVHGTKNSLTLLSNAPAHVEPSYFKAEPSVSYQVDGKRGMGYAMALAVHANGEQYVQDDVLTLKNCTSAVLVVCMKTGFEGFHKMPEQNASLLWEEPLSCAQALVEKEYDTLLGCHVSDYARLYSKVSLSLEGGESSLPLEKRLENARETGDYTSLTELLFNFGRYLLIASSRKGTQPANLQGIWNEQMRPPWSSNYTLNINTEMNYWPGPVCALGECMQPLLELVRELSNTGRKTAQVQYGMGGWVAHHNTDLWRQASPVGYREDNPVGYAFWPMGGAWLCCQLWQWYEYEPSEELLKEIYPLMKGAAEFLLDFLNTSKNGCLLTSPSTSPENSFFYQGEQINVSQMCTMDLGILLELFSACIKASEGLGVDDCFVKDVKGAMEKLPQYRVDGRGRLGEWSEDFEETDEHHRHMSHLFGLYPGSTLRNSPYTGACRATMECRGDDGTGWSLAWKACLWAALGDGDSAYRLTCRMLTLTDQENTYSVHGGGVYPNLLCAHPPFQIDGNFGITAAIASLFVQSTGQDVYLLPALPAALPNGSVRGLRAWGNVSVSLTWSNSSLTSAVLLAGSDICLILHYAGKVKKLSLQEGMEYKIRDSDYC